MPLLPFSLEDKVQMLEDDNRHLKEENADLKEQLARVLRQQFGSKSERIEVGELDIEAEEAPGPPATTPKARPDANPEPKRKRRMKVHYRKVVELIRPLYRIERELRASKAPPEEIAARRGGESRELVTAFFRTLEERAKDTSNPPVNNLRKAIDYALSRRERLVTWLEYPSIPIDNNAVERAIRPLAVGRRNSLFIGSPEAGQRSAILYTMERECQRVGVDSEARLAEALRRLPGYRGDYLDLLPGILALPGTEAAGVAQI